MDKEQYLAKLKNCIQALPVEEQKETLNYYQNYFEDAGDDNKVIDELGSPEKLAEEIKEKFACVPEKIHSKTSGSSENKSFEDNSYCHDSSLRFIFEKEKVKNIDFSLGAAQIVMISGETFSVETRGIDKNGFRCFLSQYGTLIVDTSKRLPFLSFFNHDSNVILPPRILITVPNNAELDILKIRVGAGSFETKNVVLNCNTGFVDVSAGRCVFSELHGGTIDCRCSLGELKIAGTITGRSNIDCGMGNLELSLKGDPESYSFDGKVGLGSISFNDQKKAGFSSIPSDYRKINHFSVNCGMGNVSICVKN